MGNTDGNVLIVNIAKDNMRMTALSVVMLFYHYGNQSAVFLSCCHIYLVKNLLILTYPRVSDTMNVSKFADFEIIQGGMPQ